MTDKIKSSFMSWRQRIVDMGDAEGTHAPQFSVMPPFAFDDRWWFDFYTAAGYSLIPGIRRVTALGNNPDVDTAGSEDVWSGGGLYPWMTGTTSLEILSDSTSDTSAGTGARTVLVNGLDTDYEEVAQTITLNGVTPVPLPTPLFRINSAFIMSAGSGKVNAGTLTIRDSGGGTTRAVIQLGYGITRQAIFTVPAGFTLSINSQLLCINRTGGVSRYATFANFIQSPNGFYRLPLELSISERDPYRHDGIPGIMLSEKTDYALRCASVSADNTDVTAAFLGILISNSSLEA